VGDRTLLIKERGWIDTLLSNDTETLWNKLFRLISRHSSIRLIYSQKDLSGDGKWDIYSDLTQGLYLRLLEKDRWQHYLNLNYSDDRVEQELFRIEVPNFISELQRERHPESYRLARRISDLIKTRPEFQYYPNPSLSAEGSNGTTLRRASNKMVLKVYGLAHWPAGKEIKRDANLENRVKDVAYRNRDNRRTGRGSGSQIIASNEELTQLIVDIFTAVDTPLTVRMIRRLVMSKLMIEDCWFVSLDAEFTTPSDRVSEPQRVDLPDKRPTPLDALLDKEMRQQIVNLVESLLSRMLESVRHKPNRYSKLVEVAWHCYFNPSSPSQTTIARTMGISDSLVSHYRCIFDDLIRGLTLSVDEFIQLNTALGNRLAEVKTEMAIARRRAAKHGEAKPLKLDINFSTASNANCRAVAATSSS
jgi:hypothetical protein